MSAQREIGMLLFPRLTQLDLTPMRFWRACRTPRFISWRKVSIQ